MRKFSASVSLVLLMLASAFAQERRGVSGENCGGLVYKDSEVSRRAIFDLTLN